MRTGKYSTFDIRCYARYFVCSGLRVIWFQGILPLLLPHHCLCGSFLELVGKNRNTGVNVVVQREQMASVREVPRKRVKIVLFVGKTDLELVKENVGHFVKAFQPTVVVNDRLCAAKVGA